MLDNRSRVYAFQSWTVQKKARGWYIKPTYSSGAELGPYRTEMSACLMIAQGDLLVHDVANLIDGYAHVPIRWNALLPAGSR